MGRILGLLRLFRRDIIVMLMALKERDTPGKVKGLLLLSILYLISPIDIIPDAVPFFGFLDDAVIVPTAICGLCTCCHRMCAAAASSRPTTSCATPSSLAHS